MYIISTCYFYLSSDHELNMHKHSDQEKSCSIISRTLKISPDENQTFYPSLQILPLNNTTI